MKSLPVLASILVSAGLLLSCKNRMLRLPQEGDLPPLTNTDQSEHNPGQHGLALVKKEDLVTRGRVHAIRLDSSEFRIKGLRVGEQSFYRHATPIIFFTMPPPADYVEIIRCPSNVIIHGGSDHLENVELGAGSLAEETAIFARNNFWEAASAAPGCLLIASSYTDNSFEDTLAPSGEFLYYVRACVDQGRLSGVKAFGSAHCSRLVSRSVAHSHTNHRNKDELRYLEKAGSLRSAIDTLNRRVVAITMTMNQQLYDCQERHQERIITKKQKEAISYILAGVTAVAIPGLAALIGFRSREAISVSAVGGIAAGSVISSLYTAGSQLISGFPQDAEACYSSKSTSKIAGQIRNQKGVEAQDHALLCSCAEALGSQTELYLLARQLQNKLELQQEWLSKAMGREDKTGLPGRSGKDGYAREEDRQ